MTITNRIATCDNTAIFNRKSVGDSKYIRSAKVLLLVSYSFLDVSGKIP